MCAAREGVAGVVLGTHPALCKPGVKGQGTLTPQALEMRGHMSPGSGRILPSKAAQSRWALNQYGALSHLALQG